MAAMYTSIVVGIDGSPTAEIALGKAIELARASEAELHVVSAYDAVPAHVTGKAPAAEEFQVQPSFKADAALERALGRAKDLKVEQHAPKGSPADGILKVAREANADLIVIGSIGMQGARRVLGSIPNRVTHRSDCDVLLVHTGG
jgi:nucleotide-binding universal stress UspA family protein